MGILNAEIQSFLKRLRISNNHKTFQIIVMMHTKSKRNKNYESSVGLHCANWPKNEYNISPIRFLLFYLFFVLLCLLLCILCLIFFFQIISSNLLPVIVYKIYL